MMSEQRAVGVEILDITHADDLTPSRDSVTGSGGSHTSSSSIRASIGGSIASLNPLAKRASFDGNNYVFTMQVWIPAEQHNYIISRSYKAFSLLQTQLKKKYPRSNLPVLPKASEITPNKKTSLNEYIFHLMTVPEILQSDTLLSFLDEGSPEGELLDYDSVALEVMTCMDVLLEHEKDTNKTIVATREFQLKYNVSGESVVVWRFSTHKRDIGFSVSYNGSEVVKYQRLESQNKNKPITGLFEVPSSGIDSEGRPCDAHSVVLKFDNSYSKLRSKGLLYSARVVSGAEYREAVSKAENLNVLKDGFQRQRRMLKAGLALESRKLIVSSGHSTVSLLGLEGGHRTSMSGVAGNSTLGSNSSTLSSLESESGGMAGLGSGGGAGAGTGSQPAPGGTTTTNNLHQQQQQLLDEKAGLIRAYQESLNALEEERNATANAIGKLEKASTALDVTDEELMLAREELELLKEAFTEKEEGHKRALAEIYQNQDLALDALEQHKAQLEEIHDAKRQHREQTDHVATLQLQLEKMTLAELAGQETIKILKTEKKQLRKFAIQAKADIDRLQVLNAALEAEVAALQTEVSIGAEDMQNMHRDMQRLQFNSDQEEQQQRELRSRSSDLDDAKPFGKHSALGAGLGLEDSFTSNNSDRNGNGNGNINSNSSGNETGKSWEQGEEEGAKEGEGEGTMFRDTGLDTSGTDWTQDGEREGEANDEEGGEGDENLRSRLGSNSSINRSSITSSIRGTSLDMMGPARDGWSLGEGESGTVTPHPHSDNALIKKSNSGLLSSNVYGITSRGINGALERPGAYANPPPLFLNTTGTFFGF